jgi:hypothetical protein
MELVLFEGIESTQNLNAEIFEDDGTPTNRESFFNFIPDLLTDKRDNDRRLKKASHTDKNLRDLIPEALGLAHSSMAALWSPALKTYRIHFSNPCTFVENLIASLMRSKTPLFAFTTALIYQMPSKRYGPAILKRD